MYTITLFRDLSHTGAKLENIVKQTILMIAKDHNIKIDYNTVIIPEIDPSLIFLKINDKRIMFNIEPDEETLEDTILKIMAEDINTIVLDWREVHRIFIENYIPATAITA